MAIEGNETGINRPAQNRMAFYRLGGGTMLGVRFPGVLLQQKAGGLLIG
jgi:hypothetical protein